MKKIITKIVLIALLVMPLTVPLSTRAVVSWNVTGSYVINVNYSSVDYPENLVLQQTGSNITGTSLALLDDSSPWTIDSGSVGGDVINFEGYLNNSPTWRVHFSGLIANDGSMSGDWADVSPQTRVGTWKTTSGTAKIIAPTEVATCPVDTTQTFVETKTIDSTSSIPTPSNNTLSSGVTYLLVVSGDWQNRNDSNQRMDAEYDTMDNWVTSQNGYNMGDYQLGEGEFDLQIDNAFVDWGSYNPNHIYSHLYAGNGSPVNLMVFDGDSNTPLVEPGWYGDNSGSLTVNIYSCVPNNVKVTIVKYLDEKPATIETANESSFLMTATWNAQNIGSGSGNYDLGPIGFNNPNAYYATTGDMTSGASYTTSENLSTTCDAGNPYALVGYTTGDTLEQAVAGKPGQEAPSFAQLTGDKFVVVWNKTCPPVKTLKVHILKYLDGQKADVATANGYQFPMTATWKTSNLDGGVSTSGNYVLGNNHGSAPDLYGADTAVMQAPADYTTSEITDSSSQVVSSSDQCVPGKHLLNGYRTSTVDFATAATQPLTPSAPVFTGLTADQYVIVDNSKCPTTGSISGMKYNDLNRNGKQGINEPGLQGWVIRLMSGDTVVATTITDVNGNYSFQNIAPGTYKVRETHQKGWKRMSKNPKAIVIVAGSTVTGVNFGNAQKRREEREDCDKDDNRDEQSGRYYGNHERSDYDKDQNNRDHQQPRGEKGDKDNGKNDQ